MTNDALSDMENESKTQRCISDIEYRVMINDALSDMENESKMQSTF